MFGPTPFRDIFLVAGFELREMMRSRRAIMFAVLYLLVAAVGSYFFVWILTRTQPPPSQRQNRPPRFNQPALTINSDKPEEKLMFAPGSPFYFIVRNSFDEQATVDFLAQQSPLTLFHFLISITILPMVIMITSSESIAQEHQSRGVRFIGLRTGRAEFVFGKLLGQAGIIAVLTLLAGGICLVMGAWKLGNFDSGQALMSILRFWPRLFAYCLSFLGLAGLCSMSSRSTILSRTSSIVGLIGLWILNNYAQYRITSVYEDEAHAKAWHLVQFFLPFSHQDALWHADFATYGGAMGALLLLGMLYISIGLIFYRRRDL